MNSEIAKRWRDAIERAFQILGIEQGGAIERLESAGVNIRWLKQFMNGTTDEITRPDMKNIVLALSPNLNARGLSYMRERLEYFDDEEQLLSLLLMCKPPDY